MPGFPNRYIFLCVPVLLHEANGINQVTTLQAVRCAMQHSAISWLLTKSIPIFNVDVSGQYSIEY
jgi:hypothetical protein